MNEEQEGVYQEGYAAGISGQTDDSNPYEGDLAEYWSDGLEDALEDSAQ